jgi:hypothetical protein
MPARLGREKRNLWTLENSSAFPVFEVAVGPRQRWASSLLRTPATRLAVSSRLGRRWPSSADVENTRHNLHLYAIWSHVFQEEQKRARAWSRTQEYSGKDIERFASETGAYAGRWVAIKGRRVLHSGDSLRDVVLYLRERDLRSDSLFRVPVNPEDDQIGDL